MKFCWMLPLIVLGCVRIASTQHVSEQEKSVPVLSEDPFTWQLVSETSTELPMRGAFTGIVEGKLIVAGGLRETPDRKDSFSDEVYVLDLTEGGEWEKVQKFRLEKPIAFGSTVTTDEGIICIGGLTSDGVSRKVFRLRFDPVSGRVVRDTLIELPYPRALTGASIIGDRVLVAGGISSYEELQPKSTFISLDLSVPTEERTWQHLPRLPGEPKIAPLLTVQSNGNQDLLYAIGGIGFSTNTSKGSLTHTDDAFSFNITKNEWKKLSDAPGPVGEAIGFPVGVTHLMVYSNRFDVAAVLENSNSLQKEMERNSYIYHTVTDRWIKGKPLPIEAPPIRVVSGLDTLFIISSTPEEGFQVYQQAAVERLVSMNWIDYIVFFLYFALIIAMGHFFSKRIHTTDDYFRGGKRVPWWAAGISVLVTKISAISFVSLPAKAFVSNWLYVLIPLGTLFVAYFVVNYVIPFFCRLDITSTYEYLEKRFTVGVRTVGSLSYVLYEIVRMGVLIMLPALLISVVTGFNIYLCILAIGIVATLYTLLGGIEAVIWTDVIQTGIMIGGALLGLIYIVVNTEGSVFEFTQTAYNHGKLKALDWDWSLTTATVWVFLLSFVGKINEFISNQTVVQRFISTKNEKAAGRSMWLAALMNIPVIWLFLLIGTAIFVFYESHPERLDITMAQTDAILPSFIIGELPIGIVGLMIAAIFSAAMSSIDSALNSTTTVIITDFYKRFKPETSEILAFRNAKNLTLGLGIFAIVSALLLASSDIKSLYDKAIGLIGLFGGGLAGMFALGMFTKRASSSGVLIGFFASAVVQYYLSSATSVHVFVFATSGLVSCYVFGYLFSFLFPDEHQTLEGTTIYTLSEKLI